MASLVWMPMIMGSGSLSMSSSLLRVWVISTNPGGRHRAWESEKDWCGRDSHGGVVGASTVAVAHLAVVACQPLPLDADRDPLRWAMLHWVWLFWDSCDMISITVARLLPSIWRPHPL